MRIMMKNNKQQGFVLVTALIMLSLLTLMSLAMYYASRSATQTSATAQSTTEAYYYAETAVHYIAWALANDAEFDSFKYSGTALFFEPKVPSTAPAVGDFTELRTYLWDPGPTKISDTDPLGTSGQLMYFDNSPLYTNATNNREVCFYSEPDPGTGVSLTYPNCIDVLLDPADSRRTNAQPSMHHISVSLPRYIKLEIASTGGITPSIPKLPHQNPPVAGEDIPTNGAIVWLTAVDATDPDKDIEIFPLDPASAYGGTLPEQCATLGACPCKAPATLDPLKAYNPDPADPQYSFFVTAQACNAHPLQSDDPTSPSFLATTDPNYVSPWLSTYGVAAYAIGYVNGKPSKLLRAVIM